MKEIRFNKYQTRGPGYHWEQVSHSILKKNLFTIARYKIITDIISKEVGHQNILDVGCGDGVLTYELGKTGATITGIDNNKEAINYAGSRLSSESNIRFFYGSCYNMPFENKSFEYIVATELIEHLSDPFRFLNELNRIWNKSGKIIISTPIRLTQGPLDTMHHREYFENELFELLKNSFEKVTIIKSHPLFWMELQNKNPLFKYSLNLLNLLFNFNPFLKPIGWKYYAQQTAIISG
jgi:2-polyprenyl-3-methyl-5-hydroxy-6-metoxy-1,4-benzoquinol methylase